MAHPRKHSVNLMDLSVVIVNWNTKALLLDCLQTVKDNIQQSALQTEVFVVDNASEDGSVDAVRHAFSDVNVIVNPQNVGFAAGNNSALKFATGKYCLLLNSDTLVPIGAFDELIHIMDTDKETVVCSPLLLNADKTPQICWAKFPDATSELKGELDRSQSPYPLSDFDSEEQRSNMKPFPVDWVGGACFMVRREAIQEAGLLDERFFMFGEETEWCHRFAKHGWQALLVPSITVTHLGGQSTKAVPIATRLHLYRSSLRLYRILYGTFGAILPSTIATGRFLLFPLRGWYRRRSAMKPVQ